MKPFHLIRGEGSKDSDKQEEDFEALLAKVLDRLWSFALRLGDGNSEAEDLFQETVLKAYRSFGLLKDRSRFKPWIFQILYRQWLSQKRSDRRTPLVDLPLDDETLAGRNPWDLFSWSSLDGEIREEVQAGVAKLAPEFQQVVWLKYVEGLDYKEIADILNITEGTVASRLFRAKGFLKERLWQYAKENGWVREK